MLLIKVDCSVFDLHNSLFVGEGVFESVVVLKSISPFGKVIICLVPLLWKVAENLDVYYEDLIGVLEELANEDFLGELILELLDL